MPPAGGGIAGDGRCYDYEESGTPATVAHAVWSIVVAI